MIPSAFSASALRRRLHALTFGLLLLSAPRGNAAENEVAPAPLSIGYSSQVFVGVDAEAWGIAKIWSNQIMKRKLDGQGSRNMIFRDPASLEAALHRKELDLVAIIADEYVALQGRVPMLPVFVTAHEGGVNQSVVLLVRRDAGIKGLLDLKGRRLTISIEQNKTIHLKWLEILLMREGFRAADTFFSKLARARGPSQAILSVFFGQSDACLTTRQAFRIATELNPQVGKEVFVLAQSPEAAGGVIVFRPDLAEEDKKRLSDVLASLHLDAEGRQLLGLFRMSRLLPFKSEYLESVEGLRKEHEILSRRLARGTPR